MSRADPPPMATAAPTRTRLDRASSPMVMSGQSEVELLLDRQRPEVHEQLRCGLVEVARPRRDLEPVGREGQRADHLPTDVDEQVGADDPGDEHARHDAEHEGGQQASRPAHPELREGDPAGAPVLAHEERRDEEARHDEEDVDPEEAAGQPGGVEVEDEHADDGEGAQPVETLDAVAGAVVASVGPTRSPPRPELSAPAAVASPTSSRRSLLGRRGVASDRRSVQPRCA